MHTSSKGFAISCVPAWLFDLLPAASPSIPATFGIQTCHLRAFQLLKDGELTRGRLDSGVAQPCMISCLSELVDRMHITSHIKTLPKMTGGVGILCFVGAIDVVYSLAETLVFWQMGSRQHSRLAMSPTSWRGCLLLGPLTQPTRLCCSISCSSLSPGNRYSLRSLCPVLPSQPSRCPLHARFQPWTTVSSAKMSILVY